MRRTPRNSASTANAAMPLPRKDSARSPTSSAPRSTHVENRDSRRPAACPAQPGPLGQNLTLNFPFVTPLVPDAPVGDKATAVNENVPLAPVAVSVLSVRVPLLPADVAAPAVHICPLVVVL